MTSLSNKIFEYKHINSKCAKTGIGPKNNQLVHLRKERCNLLNRKVNNITHLELFFLSNNKEPILNLNLLSVDFYFF